MSRVAHRESTGSREVGQKPPLGRGSGYVGMDVRSRVTHNHLGGVTPKTCRSAGLYLGLVEVVVVFPPPRRIGAHVMVAVVDLVVGRDAPKMGEMGDASREPTGDLQVAVYYACLPSPSTSHLYKRRQRGSFSRSRSVSLSVSPRRALPRRLEMG